MPVVCMSSIGAPRDVDPVVRGTRVAAMTGSTRRSRVGSTSCSQCNTASARRRQHVQAVVHEHRREVGQVARWKRVTTPGNPGPAPRAAQ